VVHAAKVRLAAHAARLACIAGPGYHVDFTAIPRSGSGMSAALLQRMASPPRRSAPVPPPRLLATALALAVPLLVTGCRDRHAVAELQTGLLAAIATPATAVVVAAPRNFVPSRAGCEAVVVFDRGAAAGAVCADEASARGLTVVDLSDDWTPRIFARDPESGRAPEYRDQYLRLARQPNADLGLYGISPTLTVLAERLRSDEPRACSADIDGAPLAALAGELSTSNARAAATLLRAPAARPALKAAQQQLACEGLLEKANATGLASVRAAIALDAFRRRHMIVQSGSLDASSAAALALGHDELAFRGLLRGLRERVADTAGLLEDGSAAGESALVAGRALDHGRFFRPVAERGPDAAPDLVGAATDAAARALGWTSPDAARAFLAAAGDGGLKGLRVALPLPGAPAYHARSMDLRVEIDRGDVFYDAPGEAAARRRELGQARGPTFVLLAKDGDREREVVRWSTTIGGWQKERGEDGEVALKYKESDVGDRVWRRLIAAPAWMPPDSTPEADLLREADDGTLRLKRDLIQPGHRNAFGLAMLIHDEQVVRGDETSYLDHGIRTHGSVNYRSIERGESHGCHRLYNQLVLRLAGFLLQHRPSHRKGKMGGGYQRTLEYKDQTIDFEVRSRGYLFELDPPVPVRVLRGNVAGTAQKAISTAIPLAPAERTSG
jgi:hypothetical protein